MYLVLLALFHHYFVPSSSALTNAANHPQLHELSQMSLCFSLIKSKFLGICLGCAYQLRSQIFPTCFFILIQSFKCRSFAINFRIRILDSYPNFLDTGKYNSFRTRQLPFTSTAPGAQGSSVAKRTEPSSLASLFFRSNRVTLAQLSPVCKSPLSRPACRAQLRQLGWTFHHLVFHGSSFSSLRWRVP